MYKKIINPETGRNISIYGKIGKKILRNYLKNLQFGGARKDNSNKCDIMITPPPIQPPSYPCEEIFESPEELKQHKCKIHNEHNWEATYYLPATQTTYYSCKHCSESKQD
jgi:hypothetical protein